MSESRDIHSKRDVSQQSDHPFRALADHIPQLAWIADSDGWIFWYNKRWYDFTGTTLKQMEGWGWTSVHHPDHVQRVVDRVQHSWDSGEPWEDTFPLRDRHGNYHWFLSRAMPQRNDQGEVQWWFGTNTDITDQLAHETKLTERTEALAQANEELERQRQDLASANKELERFNALLSHDLRQPARQIRMYCELLNMQNGEGEPFVQRIADIAKRLDGMVQSIEGLARLDRKRFHPEQTDLNEVLRDALQNLGLDHDDSHPSVVFSHLPTVYGDPILLVQLFQNLISNGMKYCDQRPQLQVLAQSPKPQRCWQISVADNGIGMEEEALQAIFEPFRRLQSADRYPGTGLGLSTCQRIVEIHGGRIWAESQVRVGSTFHLTLPFPEGAQE